MWPFIKRNEQKTSPALDKDTQWRETPASPELARYFLVVENGGYSELWDVEVNLLDQHQSQERTRSLSSHPIIQSLDGLVLDDPNTSNYHIYLNHTALKGSILFLSHDGDTRIVHSSLAEFMSTVDMAKRDKVWLSELHPACSPISNRQDALSELITALVEDGIDENETSILALIPSMDLRDEKLLGRLASDSNFFFGEAVAIEIEKRPATELYQTAELCSRHFHFQARDAGHRALDAIRKLNINLQ